MKISYAPYKLQSRASLNRKSGGELSGFLLRLQTEDFEAGYADCMPWPLFGDGSVQEQLKNLRAGGLTPLTVRSLYYATLDGLARDQKISLFNKKIKVRSHYTCVDIRELTAKKLAALKKAGFKTIKIKVGRDPGQEASLFSRLKDYDFSWRLDFNGKGGSSFFKKINPQLCERIEMVEDPEPFSTKGWRAFEKTFGVKVAFDQPPGAKPGQAYKGIRVIKPARDSRTPRKGDIITNSMDHPVGQSFAYWEAQRHFQKWGGQTRDHGLQTQHLFTKNSFLKNQKLSPFFTPSGGLGIGFDDLLRRQKWISL